MRSFFSSRIQAEDLLKGQYCPGEDICAITPNFPLYDEAEENYPREIEEVCAGCELLPTKPGTEPADLSMWISRALELDAMKSHGGVFSADDLTIWEWAAVEALGEARSMEQAKEIRRREQEADQEKRSNTLEAKIRGVSRG